MRKYFKNNRKNDSTKQSIKMLVCTKERLEQEAIYSLKIVFTQSTEFYFIC